MFSNKIRWNVFGMGAAALLTVSLSSMSYADAPTISGFLDTSYVYNFDQPTTGTTALRSYDAKDNNIALNNAHVAFQGTMGDAGYVIEMDAGSDALANTSAGFGTADDFDIQEAYLTYESPIGLKAGKFVTFNGIEVIESKDNPTISRGYLFGLAEPFTHVGAILRHAHSSGKWDCAAGLVNGWDIASDTNKSKTAVWKLGFTFGDPLNFALSGYHGSEQASGQAADNPATAFNETVSNEGHNRDTVDLTGVTKIIPKLALWFQGNWGQEEEVVDANGDGNLDLATWGGAGLQPVVTITDKFSVGARVEYFDDDKGARTGTADLAATNYTVTPAYKLTDNLTMRAEYRYDTANKKVWVDDKGTAKDNTSTGSLEFILTF